MKTTHSKMILACLLSLIIFTTAFANPFTGPSAPRTPEVIDWGSNFVGIKWEEPVSDGGSPILRYIIEIKYKHSSMWERIWVVPGHIRIASVGCSEGSEVELRIIAVNATGESEPSEPTRSLILKPR